MKPYLLIQILMKLIQVILYYGILHIYKSFPLTPLRSFEFDVCVQDIICMGVTFVLHLKMMICTSCWVAVGLQWHRFLPCQVLLSVQVLLWGLQLCSLAPLHSWFELWMEFFCITVCVKITYKSQKDYIRLNWEKISLQVLCTAMSHHAYQLQ